MSDERDVILNFHFSGRHRTTILYIRIRSVFQPDSIPTFPVTVYTTQIPLRLISPLHPLSLCISLSHPSLYIWIITLVVWCGIYYASAHTPTAELPSR